MRVVIIVNDVFNPFVIIIVFFSRDDSKVLGNFYSSSRGEARCNFVLLKIKCVLYYFLRNLDLKQLFYDRRH